MAKNIPSNPIMEKLLASRYARSKLVTLSRGQQVEGTILSKGDKELILDLGTKSEGVLSSREINLEQRNNLKVGDKLKAYVVMVENESGQVSLSTHPVADQVKTSSRGRGINWSKFSAFKNQKTRLTGQVLEVNKGGLIVEVEGIRGFLPNSQVGFELLSSLSHGMSDLVGQNIRVTVIEIDEDNNRLIFSQRGQISDEVLEKMKSFKNGQKVLGKIVAILPFGLVVDVTGVEGLVFISDVAWEKVEDLSNMFKVGQELKVVVTGIDEQLCRLNLSLKQLSEDPFVKLSQKYPADEVVKGEITAIAEAGVSINLEGGVEGFLPASKVTPDTTLEVGKSVTLLVDGVDVKRRRINLAPFVTSTKDLIYK